MSTMSMTTKRCAMGSAAFALALMIVAPAAVQAQSGADLMRRAMAKQAERLAGVENVTVTQDVMGMELVMYMEKRETEGGPILVPVTTSMAGIKNSVPADEASADWSNPFQEEWADRSRIVGQEHIGGEACQVLTVDDFTDLEVPGLPGGQVESGEFVPKSLRFYVDDDDLVMRRMDMEADVDHPDGATSPVKVTLLMSDYREVEGYLHPFRTHLVSEGLMDAMDMDQSELQRQLEEMRKQLADLPDAQRALVEGMVAPQIERLKSMIGEGGGVEVTLTVKSVKVNAGPPGGG